MGDAGALRERGNESFKAGNFEQAVEAYTQSLELDPRQHLCFSNRSAAYMKLGRAEEALADAERCVELAPTFAKGYSRQAAALQELKRWEDAVNVVERGIASAPDEALVKMLKEVRNRHFQDKMQGTWNGRVSEALGGYDQEMEFMDAGKVRVGVLGRSIIGSYWLDCAQDPHHLSIQVPIPDAPGMPPPPPVPYIVKLDDNGLHLCCAYMVLERPKSFEGPGYCLMKRGAAATDDVTQEIDRLSDDEKMVACARELTSALPNTKLDEPKPSDSEEVARDKLMAQVRFESSMYEVQRRFGEDLMKKVIGAVKGDEGVPDSFAKTTELKQLREKFKQCGLLEEGTSSEASPRPPAPSPAAPSPPAGATEASPGEREAAGSPDTPTGDEKRPATAAPSSGMQTGTVAAMLVVGSLAVAASVMFLRSRQRR